MARPRLKLTMDEATRAEVERRYRKTRDSRDKERLLALRLANDGQHSFDQIAEEVGRARSCVQLWLDRFMKGGVDALLKRKKAPGKISPLSDEKIQAALQKGLREGRWRTAGQIRAWLQAEHGIDRSTKGIYYWLGKMRRGVEGATPRAHPKR